MTVETPDDRPLNLRDLAQEDSPDVVRVALKRFRRRTLIRGAWVAGLALAALLVTPLLPDDRPASLAERYYASPSAPVGRSATAGSVTVTVIDARRIDRDSGAVHLLVTTTEAAPIFVQGVFTGRAVFAGGGQLHETLSGGSVSEAFANIPLPFTERALTVSVSVGRFAGSTPPPLTNITIDLSGIRELQDIWR